MDISKSPKTLINFSSTLEKKKKYAEACKSLGVTVSEICRRALDNTVLLSDKLKSEKKEATPNDNPGY